jgi:hypothetical protein
VRGNIRSRQSSLADVLTLHCDSESSARNKFVETALRESIRFASAVLGPDRLLQALTAAASDTFELTIVGDNDFYSQTRNVKLFLDSPVTDPSYLLCLRAA